jgi:hypothetical protein
MKKSRYTEEQIIGILKQHEAGVPSHVPTPSRTTTSIMRRSVTPTKSFIVL